MQDQVEVSRKDTRAAQRSQSLARDKGKREDKQARKQAGLRQPKPMKVIGGHWE